MLHYSIVVYLTDRGKKIYLFMVPIGKFSKDFNLTQIEKNCIIVLKYKILYLSDAKERILCLV